MRFNIKKITVLLLYLYIITTLIIPVSIYNKVLYVLIMLLYAINNILYIRQIERKIISYKMYEPFVIILIFTVGYLHSFFVVHDEALARQFYFCVFVLLLIYPIVDMDIDINTIIKRTSVFYMIICYIFIAYNIKFLSFVPAVIRNFLLPFDNNVFKTICDYLTIYGEGAVGNRSFFYGNGVMIHLGSVPFIIVPISLFSTELFKNSTKSKVKYLLILILLLGVAFFSTSRALILASSILIFMSFYFNIGKQKKKICLLFVCITFALSFIYLLEHSSVFSFSDTGNSLKISFIKDYINQISLKDFFVGRGLASYFYSSALKVNLAHIEITLLDFCRYFGVIVGILIYIILILPGKISNLDNNTNKYYFLIFIMYLAMSLTNPVLFNSVGTIVIIFYWYNIYITKYRKVCGFL